MVCTFFGHKDTPKEIELPLRLTLIDLIKNKKVDTFYVGNHGNFDIIVRRQLIELSKIYPIKYFVVLAYMPKEKEYPEDECPNDTIFPDGIEFTPRRFAIIYRNKWMIQRSDYVVTYVRHISNGAFEFKNLATKQNKIIIEIAPLLTSN